MTGDININISATHKDDTQTQVMKYSHSGKSRKNNNSTIIMYDSVLDDTPGASKDKNIINIKEDYIEHTKKGDAVTRFIFKENKRTKVSYVTSYGGYNMDIFTKSASVSHEEDRILIKIIYDLLEGKEEDSFREDYLPEEIISSVSMDIEIVKA